MYMSTTWKIISFVLALLGTLNANSFR